MKKRKALLVILDGWGLGQNPEVDAIYNAKTPFYDSLMAERPNATLTTFGQQVGLPEGQMGNSEVGHLNIGAGRVVYQELARINKAIKEETLAGMPAIENMIRFVKENKKAVHLMGLISDGGVHSHIEHAKALCHILHNAEVEKVYLHAFMDGRDTDPMGGKAYLEDLSATLDETNCKLATIIGRYYAMDRDTRWKRTKKAYELLVNGKGSEFQSYADAMDKSYEDGITDEFIEPVIIDKQGVIKPGDAVLFFNFRTDRPRQLVRVLTQENFPALNMTTLPLHFVTMTNYDAAYRGISVVYEKSQLKDTLGEVISKSGLTQVRIAETEKYPHVTFFFNGGREESYLGEDRILIPSPKIATYDLAPEMSAYEVTKAICDRIDSNPPDFICLNYANADMVGHTGDFNAAQKACEVVDECLERLTKQALLKNYEIIIIADHGNSDILMNEDGSPNTAHTTNPVPVIYVSNAPYSNKIRNGKLADIAPTLLELMKVDKPETMTGKSLITF